MYRVIVCLGWGFLITVILIVAVFGFGAPPILLWQVMIMVRLMPPHNIGTPEDPFYEGTPVSIMAIPIGILLGIPIYAVVSYIVWRVKRSLNKGERFR